MPACQKQSSTKSPGIPQPLLQLGEMAEGKANIRYQRRAVSTRLDRLLRTMQGPFNSCIFSHIHAYIHSYIHTYTFVILCI